MQWFCTTKQPKIIDPVAIEEKRQRILAATADQHKPNPYINDYRAALMKLLAEQTKSQDEFINWIGGLSTASMYLAFTGIESAPQNMQFVLLLSGLFSFAGVITAIAFKYFSAVRFSDLRLETTILANLAQGHDINTSIENLAKQGKPITEETTQQLLQSMDKNLDLIDPDKLQTYQEPVKAQENRMALFYRLSIALFLMGLTLFCARFILEYYSAHAHFLAV